MAVYRVLIHTYTSDKLSPKTMARVEGEIENTLKDMGIEADVEMNFQEI